MYSEDKLVLILGIRPVPPRKKFQTNLSPARKNPKSIPAQPKKNSKTIPAQLLIKKKDSTQGRAGLNIFFFYINNNNNNNGSTRLKTSNRLLFLLLRIDCKIPLSVYRSKGPKLARVKGMYGRRVTYLYLG